MHGGECKGDDEAERAGAGVYRAIQRHCDLAA